MACSDSTAAIARVVAVSTWFWVGLRVGELAGQILKSSTKLVNLCFGGRKARGQLSDLVLGVIMPYVLNLADDTLPVDLVGHRLSRGEAPKQGALPIRPQADVVAIEIALAIHGADP